MKKLTKEEIKSRIKLHENKVEYYEKKLDKLINDKKRIGFKY